MIGSAYLSICASVVLANGSAFRTLERITPTIIKESMRAIMASTFIEYYTMNYKRTIKDN